VLLVAVCAAVASARSSPVKPPPCARGLIGESETALAQLPGQPEPAILAAYGVLRRGAVAADQLPLVNSVEPAITFQLASYFPSAIRRLAPPGARGSYFLITGLPRALPVPPARCLPASLRAHRRQIVEQTAREASEPSYCIVLQNARQRFLPGGDEAECGPFAGIPRGQNLIGGFGGSSPVAALVPDGVASVHLAYRDRISLTAAVGENAYTFTPPALLVHKRDALLRHPLGLIRELNGKHLTSAERRHYQRELARVFGEIYTLTVPTRVTWIGATGQVLRSFTPRGPSSTATGISGVVVQAATTPPHVVSVG
jgi:hypothetical protein